MLNQACNCPGIYLCSASLNPIRFSPSNNSIVMFDPTQFSTAHWLLSPIAIFGRYALFALIGYLLFYVWNRRNWLYLKIQQKFPQPTDYQREIFYSALTSIIFGFVSWLFLGTPLVKYTLFYSDIHEYGIGWLLLSIPLTLVVHDTYFYWAHRWMHHPKWYRRVHLTHHKSVNPSPWAAYAFHPVEAVLEAGVIPVLLIIMPLHPISFFAFITLMLVFNVYGHLGYELFSRKMYDHPVSRWINSSIHHNLHHEKFTGNYGLYFTFWDRVCGTLREDSTSKIDQIHQGIERERSESVRGGREVRGER